MQAVHDFFEAWGMTDDAARLNAISGALADGAEYADPRAPEPLHGAEAIAEYVAMFSANAPGWTAKVVKEDTVAGCMRATVAFGGKGPDGSEMVQHGQYFAESGSDGKITKLIGFVGTGVPE